ncbi:hypothetical protein A2U01_0058816, partial [Trifolium medium]|nr:hypothetical protein [Trifolium medium]
LAWRQLATSQQKVCLLLATTGEHWRHPRHTSPGDIMILARRHQDPRLVTSRRAECSVAV